MIRVGVVRGGTNNGYDMSLHSGGHILAHLRSDKLNDKYKPVDIFIDREGVWHINGLPANIEKVANTVDVIFNTLHANDANLQQLLNHWRIPYTGSGVFSSVLGSNRAIAKEQFAALGIPTPKHILFPEYQEDVDGPMGDYAEKKAHEVCKLLPPPWVVKPVTRDSAMGIHVCKTFPELIRAFVDSLDKNVSVMVEEMIEGKFATVGVVDGFRGNDTYTFPPAEIENRFSKDEKIKLQEFARKIHNHFDCNHYSNIDFIIHPKRGIYAIEVDTLPHMHEDSIMHSNLKSVGSSMSEFIKHIINLARG